MANRSAPDVVGITRTNVTYGVIGDHGGSQELVRTSRWCSTGRA
jgi:hypothetical protein